MFWLFEDVAAKAIFDPLDGTVQMPEHSKTVSNPACLAGIASDENHAAVCHQPPDQDQKHKVRLHKSMHC